MDTWNQKTHTRSEIEAKLEKFKGYQRRYRNYPGSPYDDARLGIYGYTVRDERGYINRQVRLYKKCLEWMDKEGVEAMSDRDIYYIV